MLLAWRLRVRKHATHRCFFSWRKLYYYQRIGASHKEADQCFPTCIFPICYLSHSCTTQEDCTNSIHAQLYFLSKKASLIRERVWKCNPSLIIKLFCYVLPVTSPVASPVCPNIQNFFDLWTSISFTIWGTPNIFNFNKETYSVLIIIYFSFQLAIIVLAFVHEIF